MKEVQEVKNREKRPSKYRKDFPNAENNCRNKRRAPQEVEMQAAAKVAGPARRRRRCE